MHDNIQKIVEIISNLTDAFTAAIFFYDKDQQKIDLVAHHTLSKLFITVNQMPVNESGLLGWVLKNQQPVNMHQLQNNLRSIPYYREAENIKAFIAVPLPDNKGIITVDTKKQYSFSDKIQKILFQFAEIVNKLASDNLFYAQRKYYQHIDLIFANPDKLPGSRHRLEVYFARLLNELCSATDTDRALIAMLVDDMFEIMVHVGNIPQNTIRNNFDPAKGLAGLLLKNLRPIRIMNIKSPGQKQFIFNNDDGLTDFKSFIGVPIIVDNIAHGIICLLGSKEANWDNELYDALNPVISQLSLAVENYKLRDKLDNMRHLDYSTQVCNYRTFFYILNKKIFQYSKTFKKLWLLILKFPIVTRYVWQKDPFSADNLLKEIADCIITQLEDKHWIGRYSHDTIAIILEDLSDGNVINIQQKLEGYLVNEFKNNNKYDKFEVVSAFSCFPQHGNDLNALINHCIKSLLLKENTL